MTMTEAASAIAVRCNEQTEDDDLARAALQRRTMALPAEPDEVEALISAALLAATAFRLRDRQGLLSALRILVRATRSFETRHACA
jgi:hypothetical protein